MWMDCMPYCALIGSLNYIAVATHPNIAFAISHLTDFLDCYHSEHWSAGIWVLQYLKGMRSLCLTLGGANSIYLLGYLDSDYTNCINTS